MIHEYGHALEAALELYDQPRFQQVLYHGLENITKDDIIVDNDTFVKKVLRIESPKLISVYQGRLYEQYGIYQGERVSLYGMREYFSEGFREYFENPENLKAHDPMLYAYLKELMT